MSKLPEDFTDALARNATLSLEERVMNLEKGQHAAEIHAFNLAQRIEDRGLAAAVSILRNQLAALERRLSELDERTRGSVRVK